MFGRIDEYFLNKFAMSGAQEGGEFFTPLSLVRMIVSVIEPAHGLVLDPACGSAGMFVQTGCFIEDVRHAVVNDNRPPARGIHPEHHSPSCLSTSAASRMTCARHLSMTAERGCAVTDHTQLTQATTPGPESTGTANDDN